MAGRANQSEENETASQPVVLVIEDEPLLRDTTAEYLRLSGYAVIEVADAAERYRSVCIWEAGGYRLQRCPPAWRR